MYRYRRILSAASAIVICCALLLCACTAQIEKTPGEETVNRLPHIVSWPVEKTSAFRVGDIYTFGSYPQDVMYGEDGYKTEPIKWRLLDAGGGVLILISEYLIDARPFDESSGEWKKSGLREWLNGEFLETAFTEEERSMMLTWSGDLVTLLNTGGAKKYFKYDADRMAAPTPYAISRGAGVGDVYKTDRGLYTGWWWLRTPGYNDGMASFVDFSGSIYEGGDNADSAYIGVRPVIVVSRVGEVPSGTDTEPVVYTPLEELQTLSAGDNFTFGSYPQGIRHSLWEEGDPEPIVWRVLDIRDGKALAVSEYLLDVRVFDDDSGVWEDSELRAWLNNDFLSAAFSGEERQKLCDIDGDSMSLMTLEEVNRYMGSVPERVAQATPYAIKQGAEIYWTYNIGSWWLRTPTLPGDATAMAILLDRRGWLAFSVVTDDICVRPVILVPLPEEVLR